MTDKTKSTKLDRAVAALAAADTLHAKATLQTLAARAELAGMPARHVAAIRRAWDFLDMLGMSPAQMLEDTERIAALVTEAEDARAEQKARQS